MEKKTNKDIVIPESIVMATRAPRAPAKTIALECLIAMIAAIKNVLSPNSDTTIIDKDAINP